MDGKRADVQARPAMDRYEILLIRQKSSRKRLKGLDGRGYQTFTTDQGWWSFPEIDSLTDNMAHIQVDKDGTKAWTQIVEGLKPTMFRIEFAKIDGQWRVNELTIRAYSSHQYEKEARQAGMNLNRYLELIVEEETDAPIRDGIWDPMPK